MEKSIGHLHFPAPTLKVTKYILTQEEHHKTNTFKDEYLEIPKKNDIEFKGGCLEKGTAFFLYFCQNYVKISLIWLWLHFPRQYLFLMYRTSEQ